MSAWCPPHGPNLVQLATFSGIISFLVYSNLPSSKRGALRLLMVTQSSPYERNEKGEGSNWKLKSQKDIDGASSGNICQWDMA